MIHNKWNISCISDHRRAPWRPVLLLLLPLLLLLLLLFLLVVLLALSHS